MFSGQFIQRLFPIHVTEPGRASVVLACVNRYAQKPRLFVGDALALEITHVFPGFDPGILCSIFCLALIGQLEKTSMQDRIRIFFDPSCESLFAVHAGYLSTFHHRSPPSLILTRGHMDFSHFSKNFWEWLFRYHPIVIHDFEPLGQTNFFSYTEKSPPGEPAPDRVGTRQRC